MNKLKILWEEKPLQSIILIALVIRIIAALFSQGYGWHDDHFLIIEESQSWVDGTDWNNWLPNGQLETNPNQEPIPSGHSLFYVGIHFMLFSIMKFIGISNPAIKMLIIRFLHALFSLLIVSFSYKITKHYYTQKAAKIAGLVTALLWCMPFLSVRNLAEIVSIPFLLWGFWLILKTDKNQKISLFLWAGILMGIAFSIRFQTLVFSAGVGFVLLFTKRIKQAFIFGAGVFLSIIIIQGGIDIAIWKRPFAELTEYINYNITHKNDYGTNVWYMYTTVLLGLVIPPLSLFFYFGWFNTIKKQPLLFWPTFAFFMFHNLFANKQERFILTILPFFIIAGTVGWWQFMDKSKFWQKNQKLFKIAMVLFWTLNLIALPILSTTYTKRSRCESMAYIGKHTNAKTLILEDTNRSGVQVLPNFYSGRWIKMYDYPKPTITDSTRLTWISDGIRFNAKIQTPEYFKYNNLEVPKYVLFLGEKNIKNRVENFKKYYNINYEITIQPSYIDMLMKKITPSNNNQTIFIYKIN